MEMIKTIFKDFLLGIFSPTPVIIILLILGIILLFKNKIRKSKVVLSTSLILFSLCSLDPVVDLLLNISENKYPPFKVSSLNEENKIKYIVVLAGGYGAGIDLPLSSELAPYTLTRLVEGIVLHKAIPGSKLIFTGKGWAKKSEAQAMNEMALNLGVSSKNIILDEVSSNTFEHTKNLKVYIQNASFLLVTSAIHMERAMGLFLKAGLKPIPAPTDHLLKRKYTFFTKGILIPHGVNLHDSDIIFREFIGRVWATLLGRI